MNTFELVNIGALCGSFTIPFYQRGYRWTETQVSDLLNDVYSAEQDYCLQPIVVKQPKATGNAYLLIDGQQRLTTLWLILAHCHKDAPFTLCYDTKDNVSLLQKAFDSCPLENTISSDDYFIHLAASTIQHWFESHPEVEPNALADKLLHHTFVLRYQVSNEKAEDDGTAAFLRLNAGKIGLNSAELLRAELLNHLDSEEQQNKVALCLDEMEQALRHPSFWAMLTSKEAKAYPVRLELLWDTLAKDETKCQKDPLYTYNLLKEQENPLHDLQTAYAHLQTWYKNPLLYNKVGYLRATNTISLCGLLAIANDADFEAQLDNHIRRSISFEGKLEKLNYDENYNLIRDLLLLFNVLSATDRFPFEEYYGKTWSLEHIHAQQSELLKEDKARKAWIKAHLEALVEKNLASNDLCNSLRQLLEQDEIDDEAFQDVSNKVFQAFTLANDTDFVDTLDNLALLDRDTNASLNNSVFFLKSKRIKERNERGRFIPLCTLRVFSKYYTQPTTQETDERNLFCWGPTDREAYLDAIRTTLASFLPNESNE